ncbi:unnamed protein product [Ciceribacter selenitireducens ATCC BAA-1503]|uniref:Uncharacterized protein n=2 Tax=Ciceribacter selenitireducens TaxID=448181 RepID=A0A376AEC1_9HYPH|nr:unnamed protein product [Ciceribacter selenitireducens ATCC BAA-1503]
MCYLPAKDDPDIDRDAVGENLQDPRKKTLSDAMKTGDRPATGQSRPVKAPN